jgi:hypothetical protein
MDAKQRAYDTGEPEEEPEVPEYTQAQVDEARAEIMKAFAEYHSNLTIKENKSNSESDLRILIKEVLNDNISTSLQR